MASAQVEDRDRSKYAVNNFADDDKYTMYQPYETVRVEEPEGKKVRNIIFMIGDGMGLEQISAAWVANGGKLNLDNFSKVGLQRTYSANKLVTDSAAAGTALRYGGRPPLFLRILGSCLHPEGGNSSGCSCHCTR